MCDGEFRQGQGPGGHEGIGEKISQIVHRPTRGWAFCRNNHGCMLFVSAARHEPHPGPEEKKQELPFERETKDDIGEKNVFVNGF